MNSNRMLRPAAMLLAVGLLGAACTQSAGSSPDGSDGGASPGSADDGSSTGSSDGSGSGSGSTGQDAEAKIEYDSPINNFLGYDSDQGSDEAVERLAAEQREAQQRIVTCMEAASFDYHVVDQATAFVSDNSGGLAWDSIEFAETYGFGVSTRLFPQSAVGDDLLGHTYNDATDDQIPEDPNFLYANSLSQDDQSEYNSALYGTQDDEGGCKSAAWEGQEGTNAHQEFLLAFSDRLTQLETNLNADPRTVAAHQATTQCMHDAGYPIDDLQNVENYFYNLVGPIQQAIFAVDPFDGVDTEALSDDELDELQLAAETPTAEQLVELAEIQQTEIDAAVKLFDCNGGSRWDNAEVRAIRNELEQQFLDTFADELEPFKG